jgi:2-hydroxychromene-2-carboxylate isomerase
MEGGVTDREGAINLARELGLNVDRFTADMDAPSTRERVAAQKAEGQGFGVRGTPTWYLNGMQNVGAFDTARLRAAWDAALAAPR